MRTHPQAIKKIAFLCLIIPCVGVAQDVEWETLNRNVGIGTGSPESTLHVRSDQNVRLLVENTNIATTGDQVMFQLTNASPAKVRFVIASDGNNRWTFDNNPALDAFSISKAGTGVNEFLIQANGDGKFSGRSFATQHINTSSRHAKTDFIEIDSRELLDRLSHLPITQWRYKSETKPSKHIGPVAEDFKEIFDLGDGKTISTVDASGIALAAIKGLINRVEEKDKKIDEMHKILSNQERRILLLESMLNSLASTQ